MDTPSDRWWQDKELLQAAIRDNGGTCAEAARRLGGVSKATLANWWLQHGLPPMQPGHPGSRTPPVLPGEEVTTEEMLRARLRVLETALRKARVGDVQEAQLLQAIQQSCKAADPRFASLKKSRSSQVGEEEAALLFSDTHASEVVSADQTLGMNSYDWDEMLHRMALLQQSMLSHLRHFSAPVRTLHLWCLGDMLSGDIHDELMATNDRPGAQAAVDFGYELFRFVEQLVPEFERIRVVGVPGNHPRASKKPAAKDKHNNGDWVAYKVAEALLSKHPSVKCHFPAAAFATVTVAGRWNVLLMHGDGIRSSMPGVPWGGVVRRVTTLEQQFAAAKQPIDYVCLGHFHTANALDGVGVETFLNGSVKGLDEYSLQQFGSGRRPAQRLLTFHRERGVTGMRWLNLSDRLPAGAA